MARGQGAPGVKVELYDNSEYQYVNEPILTAGVVGFSTNGPLNKIIFLNNTEEMNSILGSAFNAPKYNQGIYAARGILNSGGVVEFVRPYGEEIVTDETNTNEYNRNQELKSDAFVVKYNYDPSALNSIVIDHYAATRWYQDKMAIDYPGSSRLIYRISDAIVEKTNVKFELNTNNTAPNTIPLFAVINEDPTSANRADGDYENVTESGDDYIIIRTAASNSASKCVENLAISGKAIISDQFKVIRADGVKVTFEFVDPQGIIPQTNPSAYPIYVDNVSFEPSNVSFTGNKLRITLPSVSGYSVMDKIVFTGVDLPSSDETTITENTIYTITSIVGNTITVGDNSTTPVDLVFVTNKNAGSGVNYVSNLTKQLKNIGNAFNQVGFGLNVQVKSNNPLLLNVVAVRGLNIPLPFTSFYDLSTLSSTYLYVDSPLQILETTPSVLIEQSIGRRFLSMGIANELYVDINFDGIMDRVYTLNNKGQDIAALYLEVDYYFSGRLYTFYGTIVPYVLDDQNMYIVETAKSVENGFKFLINEHQALMDSASDSLFNLSLTKLNGLTSSRFSKVAYSSTDPAVINNAIWVYDPKKNMSSSTLSSAWNLFLNKDISNVDMLVSAGTAIKNLFVRGLEEIDYNVMLTMLTICEKRKDCFAIFDGVDEQRVDKVLSKMAGIGNFGSDIGRWGSIFDGRSYMNDMIYTKLNVEVVKSIEVSQIITLNRASGVFWLPPSGFQTGRIPASMASRQKYIRSYGYGAGDVNSDIAKLYDANINPTRVTQNGTIIFGQKTMLKKNKALNRLNAIMLVAGIHKRFVNYLDDKVFQLNTPQLRSNIRSELQSRLNAIMSANPPGLYFGQVICDETNNTQEVIDRNELVVYTILQITKTAEFITLKTFVERTGSGVNIYTYIGE